MNNRTKVLIQSVGAALMISIIGGYVYVRSQQKSFVPSELEMAQVKSAKLEAVIAFRDFNTAQQAWNQKLSNLRAKCEEIKKNHNWPDDVICDVNQEPVIFRYKTDDEKKAEADAKAKETQEKMIKDEMEKQQKVQDELKKKQDSNPTTNQ